MSKVRLVLICLIGLMLVGFTVGVLSYRRIRTEPAEMGSSLGAETDVTLNRVHHASNRDGAREWTLDAESAEYIKDQNKTVFKSVFATFFLNNGQKVSLAGKEGVLFTDTKDIEVWGDVIVRSGPYVLETQKLCYDHEKKVLYTDTKISVRGEGMYLDGDALSLHFGAHEAVVTGHVEATLRHQWL